MKQPTTKKERLPRNHRAKHPPRFVLTERDIELIRATLTYRFLYLGQFFWLFPDSGESGIAKRLRLLFHHGYLGRQGLPVIGTVNQLVYNLTETGALLLAESTGVARDAIPWNRHRNKLSPGYLRHLLEINSVRIAFRMGLAAAQARGEITEFRVLAGTASKHKITTTLKDAGGYRYEAAVIPDAIVAVKFASGELGLFMVEIDRATETTGKWAEKVEVYTAYLQSPDLATKFQTKWFIVLTVTTGPKRIDSLAGATALAGGRRAFWFTTRGEVSPNTILGPLWCRAGDLYEVRREELTRLSGVAEATRVSLFDAVG